MKLLLHLLLLQVVCIAQTATHRIELSTGNSWQKYPTVYSRIDSCGIPKVFLSNCDSAGGLKILYEALEKCQKTDLKNYRALQAAVHFINTLPDHLKTGVYYESYQCQLDKIGTYTRGKRKENETEELIGCEE